jgi:glucoamylase
MFAPRGNRLAFGGPGMAPRWSHSNKDGVGTAYSADARLWFTLWRGAVSEVYYPRIDRPQLRDLEFLLTDGRSFFHEEKRHLTATVERPSEAGLGYEVRSEDPDGRYRLHKTVVGDPHLPCLLVRTRVERLAPGLDGNLSVFALVAPHLEVGGWGNSGSVVEVLGRPILVAEKGSVALAVSPSVPFARASVGYVGASDGWTDVSQHRRMTLEFDRAPDGNVALTGELPAGVSEFTLGLAFGDSVAGAVTTLFQSLGSPFELSRRRFVEQWARSTSKELPLAAHAADHGHLYRASHALLLAHEDKSFPGAFIASLSIPWGAARSDDDRGGYHLVWTRDAVHSANALLASGTPEPARRALIYLATRQRPDGGFPQNFWVDGTPYWQGLQLDEVALPILLAGKLEAAHELEAFDPYPMAVRGARFLIENGPVTEQDRWEELSGFSPSTLATTIAGLTVAAGLADGRGDKATARFVQEYADFLDAHVEGWTVTPRGTVVPGLPHHFVRIRPARAGDPPPEPGSPMGPLRLPNLPPGEPDTFPAEEVVDGGFVDLVRYGVRSAHDPLIVDSLAVVDRLLRVETPFGPVWRRYNHDGYGQREDGGPFVEWGTGRAWPLLAGERGHYELAAGRDASRYLRTLERLATPTGLLTEQVWDAEPLPRLHLAPGRPTEAAMPLAWAHAEYLALLRSVADGAVFDRVPAVADRYLAAGRHRSRLEVWTFAFPPRSIPPEAPLRVIAGRPFRLHLSGDDWRTVEDHDSTEAGLGLSFVDLPPLGREGRSWQFTFYWTFDDRWEGRDFAVSARSATPP